MPETKTIMIKNLKTGKFCTALDFANSIDKISFPHYTNKINAAHSRLGKMNEDKEKILKILLICEKCGLGDLHGENLKQYGVSVIIEKIEDRIKIRYDDYGYRSTIYITIKKLINNIIYRQTEIVDNLYKTSISHTEES
jgi:hypothetical protein